MALDRRAFVASGAAAGVGALAGCATSGVAAPVGPEVDPFFSQPYVDVDEWRDAPARHRYVHGGFQGNQARFVILFPPPARYQGRFIQYNTAIPVSELQAGAVFGDEFMGFCFDSGAAAVVTNQDATGNDPSGLADPTLGAYRVAAAAARYTRVLANQMYGPHRTYGYAFGGSGGGYRTMSCAEHTDAWDGVVPFMHGNLQAWPNNYAARARVQRALKHKLPRIADAVEPGGGDMYDGLDEQERAILGEATKLGFPARAWSFHETMGVGPLAIIFPNIQRLDPTYFDDFWRQPGYLGHDRPQDFEGVRVQHRTRVTRVIMTNEAAASGVPAPGMASGRRLNPADPDTAWRAVQDQMGAPAPVALQVESLPPAGSFLDLANIRFVSGANAGRWLVFDGGVGRNIAKLQFGPTGGPDRSITDNIRVGDEVVIDNSNILAYETYYRHGLLPPDYYVGNQFRRSDGAPIYPQRPVNISADLMRGAMPEVPSGAFHGKMIVLQYLLDWDAQPWYADHYRTRVRERYGAEFNDKYRLYYVDYATHGAIPDTTRTIRYWGALQQAIRDVAAWAERGAAPPQETAYQVVEGQVVVPEAAGARKGIQPVVALRANGSVRAEARAGEPVEFSAVIEAPPGAGPIVSAEWDFDATSEVAPGDDRFPVAEQVAPAERLTLTRRHAFTRAGTYFPALRVHSQREGDATTPYARVPNLGRVRVVVT